MSHILARDADFVDHARMRGLLFDLGRYPGATPADDSNSQVLGDVYRLRKPEKILESLDRYEGFDPSQPSGSEYRRVRRKVKLASGKEILAWVYLYNQPTEGQRRIRSGNYLRRSKTARGLIEVKRRRAS
jgi:gamma-glutamylcyclotransferase (GGCT)/AIG2-like uncharacterized protein YtfP